MNRFPRPCRPRPLEAYRLRREINAIDRILDRDTRRHQGDPLYERLLEIYDTYAPLRYPGPFVDDIFVGKHWGVSAGDKNEPHRRMAVADALHHAVNSTTCCGIFYYDNGSGAKSKLQADDIRVGRHRA